MKLNEIEKYTINSFRFLIPLNCTISSRCFAENIISYSNNKKSRLCSDAIKLRNFFLTRKNDGIKIYYK